MIFQGMIIYFIFTLFIIVTIFLKKKPILIAASGLIAVGVLETGSLFGGLQVAFRGLLLTATDLLPIILLIGLVVAMTNMLRTTQADTLITRPFMRLKSTSSAYWILGISLWALTLFLWPTPAVTLLGAVALPVMTNTKMNPLGLAMGFCIFGGMGLAGDFIIQGAPALLAKSAGVDVERVIPASIPLVIGSGIAAALLGYWRLLRINKETEVLTEVDIKKTDEIEVVNNGQNDGRLVFLALFVAGSYILTIFWLLQSGLRGDSAAAATGGVSIAILIFGTVLFDYKKALNNFVLHIQEGMKVSMGVFAPIVVIAGFFLLGTQSGNEIVLERMGPGYLKSLAMQLSEWISLNEITSAVIVVLAAILGAMSGSGFSAIPLVGGVAAALGEAGGLPVIPLAVLGQTAAIWTDATIIPWGFPAVVGAITRTEGMKISRQNIIPWAAALIFLFVWTILCLGD